MDSRSNKHDALTYAVTTRLAPSKPASNFILLHLKDFKLAIMATHTSWKDALYELPNFFNDKDPDTRQAKKCVQTEVIKCLAIYPEPEYQPRIQNIPNVFAPQVAGAHPTEVNPHFISAGFAVTSYATATQDKLNRETQYKKHKEEHYKRVYCKLACWMARKYLPLNLGAKIATAFVNFRTQKEKESEISFLETYHNQFLLQNEISALHNHDLRNLFALNAQHPQNNTDLDTGNALIVNVARLEFKDFLDGYASRLKSTDLGNRIAHNTYIGDVDQLRDYLKQEQEFTQRSKQLNRNVHVPTRKPRYVSTVQSGKRKRTDKDNLPPKKRYLREKPAGCPDGYCWEFFEKGKCTFKERTGKECGFKHEQPDSTSNAISKEDYEKAKRTQQQYESANDKPFSCCIMAANSSNFISVAGKTSCTLNVIDQYARFKNIDNVNVLDISDGYGRVYTTFALLVKLCFVFVALVEIQPKCMDIFYVGMQHMSKNMTIASFVLNTVRNTCATHGALLLMSGSIIIAAHLLSPMQHISILHKVSNNARAIRNMLSRSRRAVCVLLLCCFAIISVVYMCSGANKCNTILVDELVLASKEWRPNTSADNVLFMRISLNQSEPYELLSVLIDTGSAPTLTSVAAVERYVANKPCCVKAFTKFAAPRQFRVADESGMKAIGAVTIRINFSPRIYKDIDFLVVDKLSCNFIIGKGEFRSWKPLLDLDDMSAKLRAFTQNLEVKFFDNPLPHE